MLKPKLQADAPDDERFLYPDMPSYVSTEAALIDAVRAGIASYDAGPTIDLDVVEAELRTLIHGPA